MEEGITSSICEASDGGDEDVNMGELDHSCLGQSVSLPRQFQSVNSIVKFFGGTKFFLHKSSFVVRSFQIY